LLNGRNDSATLSYWIYFDNSDLSADEISYFEVESPEGYWWKFEDPEAIDYFFYGEDKCIGGWYMNYNDYIYSNGSVLEIGPHIFTIMLKNGNSDSYTFNIPAPGSDIDGSITHVFTEDYIYADTAASNFAALPLRADISQAIFDSENSRLTIDFSIDDEIVANGYLWIYNSSGDPIGNTDIFIDYENNTHAAYLNSGAGLYNDGTLNSLIINNSDITIYDGFSFADVAELHIVLTDGFQYPGQIAYDCRSISEVFVVQ
jgi:hypothetical protein